MVRKKSKLTLASDKDVEVKVVPVDEGLRWGRCLGENRRRTTVHVVRAGSITADPKKKGELVARAVCGFVIRPIERFASISVKCARCLEVLAVFPGRSEMKK